MIRVPLVLVIVLGTFGVPAFFDASAATLELTGTIRDFNDTHPDFESVIAFDPGIVLPDLGPDDKPVYAGLANNPTTHGADAFYQWYNDVPGINQTAPLVLVLGQIGANPPLYQYTNNNFFPIDNQLFGNQGRPHNYHFTLEVHSRFTYQGGEVFTFQGDDDLWVFINGKLAIDLGGVHASMTATVNLDAAASSLGITPGGNYTFDLFFAERHTVASNFTITTTILLLQEVCGDGIDNDLDGFTDCSDSECAALTECTIVIINPPAEICWDGLDNDEDGLFDCDDPSCMSDPVCEIPDEICGDGLDNDGNGLVDCKDPVCNLLPTCLCEPGPELCNGQDDNCNEIADDNCTCPNGDVNKDMTIDVVDVQCMMVVSLAYLTTAPLPDCLAVPFQYADLNCDGTTNISDVILAIQFIFKKPLDPSLDANGDFCVDVCL